MSNIRYLVTDAQPTPNGTQVTLGAASSLAVPDLPRTPWRRNSLTAAASRITGKARAITRGTGTGGGWQAEAWQMFDSVGELHYIISTLANRVSQARLTIEQTSEDGGDPDEVTSGPAYDALASLRASNFSGLLNRMATGILVAGETYLVGLPREGAAGGYLDDLKWSTYSRKQLTFRDGTLTVGGVEYLYSDVFVLYIHKPHPYLDEPDSAVRAALPVLKEIVGANLYVSAQIDSRLAGAGILVVPESVDRSVRAANDSVAGDESPFVEALMEAMLTPIADRSSPASVVPITVTVPDDSVANFEHITFHAPLDTETTSLRDAAIQRLALSMDIPPEILTGNGDQNHWSSWLTAEEMVTTHLWPVLSLISEALTENLLRPALENQVSDPARYSVGFDVQHLVAKPDRSTAAMELFDRGVISAEVLRREAGFDEGDAPQDGEVVSPALPVVSGPAEDPSRTSERSIPSTNPR